MDPNDLATSIRTLHGLLQELYALDQSWSWRGGWPEGTPGSLLHAPASEADIAAAERESGHAFPPSYRRFLQLHSAWEHCFLDFTLVGTSPPVVARARSEIAGYVQEQRDDLNRKLRGDLSPASIAAWEAQQDRFLCLANHIVIGTDFQENVWVYDASSGRADGEMTLRKWDTSFGAQDPEFATFHAFLDWMILEAQARLAFVRESLAKAQGQEPEPPAAPAGALAPDVYYRNDDLWITLADTHALVRCPRSGAARQVWRSEDPSVVTVGLHQERIDAWDEDISVVALAPAGTEVERGERFGTAIDADGEEHALLSPFSGEIVTVNPEVVEDPMAPGSDWLHGGWLIQLRLDDLGQAPGLQPLENHSHPRPFDDEDEEREFFEQLMDDHTEGDTLLAIAIATELSTTFVAQRLISLGLLER